MNNSKYVLLVKDDSVVDAAVNLLSLSNLTKDIAMIVAKDDLVLLPDAVPYLVYDNTGLSLVSAGFKPLHIADIYTKLLYRKRALFSELLIQAIKIKHNKPPAMVQVLDMTAGLAKDAYLIAMLGYQVTIVEHNPLLGVILHYALLNNLLPANMRVVYGDSYELLHMGLLGKADIIYLDPMFAHMPTAKAKKEMQLIQQLEAMDNFNPETISLLSSNLLELALRLALTKVVVKRHYQQRSLLTNPLPTFVKQGSTIRYDVYVVNNVYDL